MDWIKPAKENDPLLLGNGEKHLFAAAALNFTFDHSQVALIRDRAIQEFLTEFDELCALNKSTVVSERLNHFNISNAQPQDYCERIFQIDPLGLVLVGIRWVGGNPMKPFVSVWPDYEVSLSSDIDCLIKLAAAEFKVFSPKHISLWLNPNTPLANELRQSVTPKRRYFVAQLTHLKSLVRPSRYDDVSLVRPSNDDYYSWYVESYREFHAAHPDLKDWVPFNDKEEMEECRKSGLLFLVEVNGLKAGLIAGNSQPLLGMRGLYFTEIMMTNAFKGQGLAPAVQRKFIDNLPSDYEAVWGTIDAKNVASTKTALKVGRRSIREEFFIEI